MSAARKIWLTLAGKASHALDRMAAPPDTLDQSYQRQVNLLTKVQRELAASHECLDQQLNVLAQQQAKLETQRRRAMENGREDLTREASARWAEIDRQRSELTAQRDSWRVEQDRFTRAYRQLTARVEAFCAKHEATQPPALASARDRMSVRQALWPRQHRAAQAQHRARQS